MTDTIKLENLKPAEGSTHKSKRVGRGRSSGHGKTSCRGHNGEDNALEALQKEDLKVDKCLHIEDYLN